MINVDVQRVTVGDVDLAYTTAGDPTDPPVLLVAGLGAQLISWDDGFCQALLDRGLYAIRFDNRDAGLSSHLGEAAPELAYALADLAADAAGLIDALGLGSAHVVGASMGGMIVQLLAIEHPDRVRSLTSIMSTTGDPAVGEASDAAIAVLMAPPAGSREGVLDGAVVANRIMGSPSYPMAAEELRSRAGRAFDRAYDPAGFARQLKACMTTPDRTEALRRLDLPALIVHGAADALIGVSGGRATAAAIPGSELLVLDGVGHELPEAVWPVVVDRI
ncbi:MAG TPA: alpha/beta hydrolase, partial [Microlunatus sp.]